MWKSSRAKLCTEQRLFFMAFYCPAGINTDCPLTRPHEIGDRWVAESRGRTPSNGQGRAVEPARQHPGRGCPADDRLDGLSRFASSQCHTLGVFYHSLLETHCCAFWQVGGCAKYTEWNPMFSLLFYLLIPIPLAFCPMGCGADSVWGEFFGSASLPAKALIGEVGAHVCLLCVLSQHRP